jgi:hypothetical protein
MRNILFTCMLSFLGQFSICQNNEVSKVIIKESFVDSILNDVTEKQYIDTSKSVFILHLIKKEDKVLLKMGGIAKNDLSFLLKKRNQKVIGFTEYKEFRIIIIGKSLYGLFEETSNKAFFKYLKPFDEIEREDTSNPPVISEPVVWKYISERNKINFIGSEYYDLLGEQW